MRKQFYFALIPIFLFVIPSLSQARVNSFTAGMDAGVDIDHYNWKNTGQNSSSSTNQSRRDYHRLVATPSFDFTSKDVKDNIELKYSLGLNYDWKQKKKNVDHNLDVSAQRSLTQNWKINISELYIKTDDANLTANTNSSTTDSSTSSTGAPTSNYGQDNNVKSAGGGSSDQISSELGRHRFWRNISALNSQYTYHEDSLISLGYSYSILRNNASGTQNYQDYDKHDGSLSTTYRFNPEWKAALGGDYIRGLYPKQDQATLGTQSNLKEYHGNASLEMDKFIHNVFSLAYLYTGTRYDNPARNNNEIQQGTLSWKHEFSPHVNSDLGGGPTYVKTEGQSGKTGYNAHANLNYAIEHGKFDIGLEKTYTVQNFSGTSTGGTIDEWTAKGDFNYQLYEHFSYELFAAYSNQDHSNANVDTSSNTTTSYKEKISSAGVTLKYGFWHWFTATLGYTFTHRTADSDLIDQYDENRVYLTIGAKNELFRW